ncbi:MAG: C10 family peptidase, partial [Clostridium sp.]|nr:C10 family peptidase [Clostridium sp.]
MKNRYILLGGLALAAMPLMAKTLSPEEALARANQDTNGKRMAASAPLKLAHTSKTPSGEAAVYVFNRGENLGYMLLGADDMALPVLGYSDEGSFAVENISPDFEWWLSEYGRRIEYANQSGALSGASAEDQGEGPKFLFATAVKGEAIAPQIKTLWDQIEPYNNKAPLYGANRTYTGCVATAMAQVMNYWQYPEKGQGSISYTSESIAKKLTLDFSRKKFDWANMLERYIPGEYTSAQADAVAYLMQACGYSVRSDYSTDATGALAMNIRKGLVKYFNYDGNSKYELRAYYTTPEWEQMIYDNLKNVGPILYGGGSYLGGGHSFICDGYDGNGMFHFNWGWSGISNGYFALDALTPDALGTG